MTASIEIELRAALAALMDARHAMTTEPLMTTREVVVRELATAEVSIGRVLHLIAGVPPKEPRA